MLMTTMLLVVPATATVGVDGAGCASRMKTGAGREPRDEDDAAIRTEQVGQARVKCDMGEGNVANADKLPGENSRVGGVGGEVSQGLLP
jgi:hypothetical protein